MASERKVKRSLVALSSAAVLSVYGAGYMRTKAAAERFSDEPAQRPARVPALSPAPASPNAAPAAVAAPAPARIPSEVNPAASATAGVSAQRAEAATTASKIQTTAADTKTATAVVQVIPQPAAPVVRADAAVSAPEPAATSSSAAAAPAPMAVESAGQALSSLPTAALPSVAASSAPASQYKDGTYTGWGTCRHGDIQARVVIAGGRIASATIAQCLTRYSCSWISPLPPQVVVRQSPETDYVSGATQSTNAFYYAVIEALTAAKTK